MKALLKLIFSREAPPFLEDYTEKGKIASALEGGYRTTHKESRRISSLHPLVSIVTVVRNGEATLEKTIQSVESQTYQPIEHIIIDGSSTDGTLDIIRCHEHSIAYWLSEPDKGIYDGFNKGVAACTGEFIGILNADDWMSRDQIANAVASLQKSGADFVHGNIYYHKRNGQKVFRQGNPEYAKTIRKIMTQLYHTTMLCRKELFTNVGLFRTTYKIGGDYDWFVRLHNQGFIGIYDSRITGHMNVGGVSTTFRRWAVFEGFVGCVKNGYPFFPALINWGRWFLFIDGEPPWVSKLAGLMTPVSRRTQRRRACK